MTSSGNARRAEPWPRGKVLETKAGPGTTDTHSLRPLVRSLRFVRFGRSLVLALVMVVVAQAPRPVHLARALPVTPNMVPAYRGVSLVERHFFAKSLADCHLYQLPFLTTQEP